MGSIARAHSIPKIRRLLQAAGPMSVAQIAEATGMSKPKVQHWLNRMMDVDRYREGREFYYQMAPGER